MADTPADRFRENASEIIGTIVTGVWMVALFTGQEWWLVAMLIGYLIVLPIVSYLTGETDELDEWWGDWEWGGERSTGREAGAPADGAPADPGLDPDDEALDTLRDRYARGELTDEQFERKLDRLLESETLEDLEDRRRERERDRS